MVYRSIMNTAAERVSEKITAVEGRKIRRFKSSFPRGRFLCKLAQ